MDGLLSEGDQQTDQNGRQKREDQDGFRAEVGSFVLRNHLGFQGLRVRLGGMSCGKAPDQVIQLSFLIAIHCVGASAEGLAGHAA